MTRPCRIRAALSSPRLIRAETTATGPSVLRIVCTSSVRLCIEEKRKNNPGHVLECVHMRCEKDVTTGRSTRFCGGSSPLKDGGNVSVRRATSLGESPNSSISFTSNTKSRPSKQSFEHAFTEAFRTKGSLLMSSDASPLLGGVGESGAPISGGPGFSPCCCLFRIEGGTYFDMVCTVDVDLHRGATRGGHAPKYDGKGGQETNQCCICRHTKKDREGGCRNAGSGCGKAPFHDVVIGQLQSHLSALLPAYTQWHIRRNFFFPMGPLPVAKGKYVRDNPPGGLLRL